MGVVVGRDRGGRRRRRRLRARSGSPQRSSEQVVGRRHDEPFGCRRRRDRPSACRRTALVRRSPLRRRRRSPAHTMASWATALVRRTVRARSDHAVSGPTRSNASSAAQVTAMTEIPGRSSVIAIAKASTRRTTATICGSSNHVTRRCPDFFVTPPRRGRLTARASAIGTIPASKMALRNARRAPRTPTSEAKKATRRARYGVACGQVLAGRLRDRRRAPATGGRAAATARNRKQWQAEEVGAGRVQVVKARHAASRPRRHSGQSSSSNRSPSTIHLAALVGVLGCRLRRQTRRDRLALVDARPSGRVQPVRRVQVLDDVPLAETVDVVECDAAVDHAAPARDRATGGVLGRLQARGGRTAAGC